MHKFLFGISFLGLTALTGAAVAQSMPADEASRDEDSIVVTARAAKLYRAAGITSGKLPTEPLKTSQSIAVITNELIADQGARDAQDLYRNISGVSFFSYAGVTARGFRQQENFYDGLRGDPYIGFSVPQLFNIERVEFLKGPAGMLYGQTAPGGLFNYVTKKPSDSFAASIGGVVGTMDRYGVQGEITGPVNDMIAVRAGGFFEDRDLPRNNAGSRTLLLDGGTSFQLGDRAKLTTQLLRIEQDLDGNRLRGVPVDNAGNFLASRRWNHNEPGDYLDLRSTTAQAKLDVEATDQLHLDVAGRYIRATETQKWHAPGVFLDRDGNGVSDAITREYVDQFRRSHIWSFGANAVWSTELAQNISNRLLAGADYATTKLLFNNRNVPGTAIPTAGRPCPLSLSNPVYRACDASTYVLGTTSSQLTQAKRYGFYLLEELTIGRLIAVAGVRTDRFRDTSQAGTAPKTGTEGGDETYRLGLVWRVRDDVSLFGQWATSFEPQSIGQQDPAAGGPFDPTTGRIVEAGVKTALLDGRVQTSASIYQIKRVNLLLSDPRGDPEGDGVLNFLAAGEVTSKGLDLDIAADVTDNWVVTINYAYNDTKITKTNGRTTIINSVPGGRFANAPKNKFGFWTRYQFPATGIAVALGGDYVSERLSLNNQRVKPYFVFDGSVSWTRGPWQLRARIDNILDKTYAASGFTTVNGHFPGEPRSAFLEVGYNF